MFSQTQQSYNPIITESDKDEHKWTTGQSSKNCVEYIIQSKFQRQQYNPNRQTR